jgi:hypothetical protein
METNNMPLIITQGKQDVSKDVVKYEVITAANVLVQIVSLSLVDNTPNTLSIKMQVLEGQYKNRFVDDRVSFDPTSALSWRYRAVRKAVGVPYKESEPAAIDIESIFLKKALRVDLNVRKGKDKEGNPKDYQAINYKPMAISTQTSEAITNVAVQNTVVPTPTATLTKPQPTTSSWEDDDNLPF